MQLREVLKSELQCDVEVYEAKEITLCGLPCNYLDYWIGPCYMYPAGARFNKYLFVLNGYYVTISCTCSPDRYPMRKEQISQVLRTLKFTKKKDPVSENGTAK